VGRGEKEKNFDFLPTYGRSGLIYVFVMSLKMDLLRSAVMLCEKRVMYVLLRVRIFLTVNENLKGRKNGWGYAM